MIKDPTILELNEIENEMKKFSFDVFKESEEEIIDINIDDDFSDKYEDNYIPENIEIEEISLDNDSFDDYESEIETMIYNKYKNKNIDEIELSEIIEEIDDENLGRRIYNKLKNEKIESLFEDHDIKEISSNDTSIYMYEASKYPLLKKDEEDAYAIACIKGDVYAREMLINSNLRLVVSLAKKQIGKGIDFDDLVSAGNLGLMKAIDKFKPELGYRLATYATYWIKQYIKAEIQNYGNTIRKPVWVDEYNRSINRISNELSNKLGRKPTDEEIAEAMGVNVKRIEAIKRNNLTIVELDATIKSDKDTKNETSIIDTCADNSIDIEHQILVDETIKMFNEAVEDGVINEREKFVLTKHYGMFDNDSLTLEEIGKSMGGITRERVRQIEANAMRKIKHPGTTRKFRRKKFA